MYQESMIGGRPCYCYWTENAPILLLQPIDSNGQRNLDQEVKAIRALAGDIPFSLVAFKVDDWNQDLTPWEAPPVFGTEGFGNGAPATLKYILNELIPYLEGQTDTALSIYLGGYSLAGLFALWAGYATDRFAGIAGVSPSVWYPGWQDYVQGHSFQASKVYLSLGDREERTRNKTMAAVGDAIRLQYEILKEDRPCVLEWNPGNHFVDSDKRTAKGFAWLMK